MTVPLPFLDAMPAVILAVLAYVFVVWLVSLGMRDASIMDIAWGPGFVLAAVAAALSAGSVSGRAVWVLVMVALWGFRLGGHIMAAQAGRGEDVRYAKWRREAGASWWWRSWFKVFLLQGVILCLVSLPVVAQASAPGPSVPTVWDLVGILLWLTGFLFESVADWQMLRFRRTRRTAGAVMESGLWRWSRHPNYFGESLVWWGLGCMALSIDGGWVTLVGPALITWLLLKVSGVTMLEKVLSDSKPGYADYARRTSSFIPRKPRG